MCSHLVAEAVETTTASFRTEVTMNDNTFQSLFVADESESEKSVNNVFPEYPEENPLRPVSG